MSNKVTINIQNLLDYMNTLPENEPVNIVKISQHFNAQATSEYDLDFVLPEVFQASIREITVNVLNFALCIDYQANLPKQFTGLKRMAYPNHPHPMLGPYVYETESSKMLTYYPNYAETKQYQKVNNAEYTNRLTNWIYKIQTTN